MRKMQPAATWGWCVCHVGINDGGRPLLAEEVAPSRRPSRRGSPCMCLVVICSSRKEGRRGTNAAPRVRRHLVRVRLAPGVVVARAVRYAQLVVAAHLSILHLRADDLCGNQPLSPVRRSMPRRGRFGSKLDRGAFSWSALDARRGNAVETREKAALKL